MVKGTREQAEAQVRELAVRVESLGPSLAPQKSGLTQIDAGFQFLGMRIIRIIDRNGNRHVYTFPSGEALATVKRKVKALTRRSTTNLDLAALLWALNPVLRGWAGYFRHAAAKRTLDYLGSYAWGRVVRWPRKKHPRLTWRQLRRRHMGGGWRIEAKGISLYDPGAMRVERYRFRGARISTPWNEGMPDPSGARNRSTRHDDPAFLGRLQEALA